MRLRLGILLVIALVVVSCGGGEASPSSTVQEATTSTTSPEADTTTTSAATSDETTSLDSVLAGARAASDESYRFQANISMLGAGMADQGFPDGLDMQVNATIDPANNASVIVMDMGDVFGQVSPADLEGISQDDLDALSQPIEVITIGTQSWTRMGFFSMMFGVDPNSYIEGEGDVIGVNELGNSFTSPDEFTQMFEEADAEVEDLGIEEVRGVETRHLRAVVDGAKVAETMDPTERREFERNFPSDIEFPIEIWVGEADDRLYRYLLQLDATLLASTEDPDLADIDSMTMLVEIWDYGAVGSIEPPPADLIVTEEQLAEGFLGDTAN